MSQLEVAKEELIRSNENFRSLYEEHRAYKKRLDAIRSRSLQSQEDEGEVKRIKLHKLTLKDRMESILRNHVRASA
jgi:uncharacterized protein YdcH (DUF465 family)